MINRGTIVLLIIAFVAASIIGILYATNRIDTAQTLEIAALTTLVLITAWYAKQTTIMAEEMREQRYDGVRPIIDIKRLKTTEPLALAKEAYSAGEGILPKLLPCRLRNVGVGPAIDLYFFIHHPNYDKRQKHFYGTLVKEDGETDKYDLSPEQEDGRMALVTYYKDVYGRDFKSSREIILKKDQHSYEIGPLKITLKRTKLP